MAINEQGLMVALGAVLLADRALAVDRRGVGMGRAQGGDEVAQERRHVICKLGGRARPGRASR